MSPPIVHHHNPRINYERGFTMDLSSKRQEKTKLTATSCIRSAASAIWPWSSLIFASFLVRRALSISTYIYTRGVQNTKTITQNVSRYDLKSNKQHQFLQLLTFPADTLFNVLISSIRVSMSGVWSIYCIACCTMDCTAYMHTQKFTKINTHLSLSIINLNFNKILKMKNVKIGDEVNTPKKEKREVK